MSNALTPSPAMGVNLSHPRMIRLFRQSHRYSLFQAIRDIESVADQMPRVGEAVNPELEALRIQQTPDLGFAPSTVRSIWRQPQGRVAVDQSAFGMLGPAGALPIHLTELIRNRARHAQDHATRSFIDIFHHRMAELFYRAWSCSRPTVQRDRPWDDRFSRYAASLAGYGLKHAKHRDRWPDESKWFFSGRLASLRRNAEGLEAIVSQTVGSTSKVLPFQLQKLEVPPEDRSQLGRHNHQLGQSSLLGRRVADRQGLIELRVGPLGHGKFSQLMPGQQRRKTLESIVKNYTGIGTETNLRLVLDKTAVPKLQLGKQGTLGRNAWLYGRQPSQDLDDCTLRIGR